ncbi:hypothetical protein CZ674_00980 [Agrococcus casei LMG 22410]|uniref:Uncharacterized protein n=1 Tax=Agrococcus casei LMG 22410 TaxID=1255656 RepID=A0A1R4EUT7_9MICO|nr:hypothetical protein CZ674_00980 [Agrococcus casei LMG 22410]
MIHASSVVVRAAHEPRMVFSEQCGYPGRPEGHTVVTLSSPGVHPRLEHWVNVR